MEKIKLSDFLVDVAEAYGYDASDFEYPSHTYNKCPMCGKYLGGDKFCPNDGHVAVERTTSKPDDNVDRCIYEAIYHITEDDNDKSPYKHIDTIEKRGDGECYYTCFIFQRLSDNKYFYYSSYGGTIENDTLYECERVETVVWSFEKNFD